MSKIQAIKDSISRLLINSLLWRVTGFVSSIVGFTCYAIGPSFQNLFGQWTPLKIVVYTVLTSLLSILMLFVHKCTLANYLSRAPVGFRVFLVLTLTSVWSVLEERSEEGKVKNGYEKMLKLTSTVAFAMMALSWSRLLQLGFEVGLSNFFCEVVLVTVMKMSIKLVPLAAFLCFLLVNLRYISDYLSSSERPAIPVNLPGATVPFRPEEEVPPRHEETETETAFSGAVVVIENPSEDVTRHEETETAFSGAVVVIEDLSEDVCYKTPPRPEPELEPEIPMASMDAITDDDDGWLSLSLPQPQPRRRRRQLLRR